MTIEYGSVADLYDSYVTVGFDIPFFLQEALKVRGGRVLELTSGTGRVSLPLLEAGVKLTCVDSSREMLAVLRRKLTERRLAGTIIEADITRLSLKDRYDLIFIPFNAFSEILERPHQAEALRRIRAHLTESGRFICTLHNPNVRRKSLDGALTVLGRFPVRSGGVLIVRALMNYDASSRIAHGRQFYELYDERGGLSGKRELDIRFYLFTREEFEPLALSAGLMVRELWGNYDRSAFDDNDSPFMIWTLEKAPV